MSRLFAITPASLVRHRIFKSDCIFGEWLRNISGAPAIEFALLAPVMFVMLTGSYDITQALIAMRQVTSTAQEVVQIATEQSVQPDQTTSLTILQGYQAQTAIYAMIPGLKSGTDTSSFSVTLSGVVYTATPVGCVSGINCVYVANTAWSNALPQGAQVTRPCGVIGQVASGQPATITTLPTLGMTVLSSIVVADVSYVYVPLFTGFLTGPVTLQRLAFLPPRAGKPTQYVQYDQANAKTNPSVCKGYL
jgi:Flp pilus assembly protein TadG